MDTASCTSAWSKCIIKVVELQGAIRRYTFQSLAKLYKLKIAFFINLLTKFWTFWIHFDHQTLTNYTVRWHDLFLSAEAPGAESSDETCESFAFALVNGALGVFEVHGRRIRDFRYSNYCPCRIKWEYVKWPFFRAFIIILAPSDLCSHQLGSTTALSSGTSLDVIDQNWNMC
jgi:hypothetical protein